MKKVGILTFHRAVNYGACLQAYALKQVIKDLGFSCDIIDYRCAAVEDFYNKIFLKGASLKTTIKNLLTWNVQRKRNQLFEKFVDNYLFFASAVRSYNKCDILEVNSIYDLFIVGSDQVWSPLCTAEDKTYFLDFVHDNNKKCSYAASLGVRNDVFFSQESIKQLLSEFRYISVRERVAVDLLNELIGESVKNPVTQSLDPTFLLSREDWRRIIPTINNGRYIFVYSLSMPDEVVKYAKIMQDETKMPVVYFTLDNLFSIKHRNEVVVGSPLDFLSYILNAEFVITNSFHGTAFSLIFNKDFIVLKNINPDHDNSRIIDIMRLMGLENRLLNAGDVSRPVDTLDYEYVNKKLENMRKDSFEYLREVLRTLSLT